MMVTYVRSVKPRINGIPWYTKVSRDAREKYIYIYIYDDDMQFIRH